MPEFKFSYTTYNSLSALTEVQQQLAASAKQAAEKAYAPYSKFKVGCSVLLGNNEIIKGANVENASYPVGICAERSALSYAISNHPDEKIISLAIYSESEKQHTEAVMPCGMCRQFMVECEEQNNQAIELILCAPNFEKIIIIEKAEHLLPFAFTAKNF